VWGATVARAIEGFNRILTLKSPQFKEQSCNFFVGAKSCHLHETIAHLTQFVDAIEIGCSARATLR